MILTILGVIKVNFPGWFLFNLPFGGDFDTGRITRSPVVPFYPFLGEGSPTKIDKAEKMGTNLF